MASNPDLAVLYDSDDKLSIFWRLGRLVNRTRLDIPAPSWNKAYARLKSVSRYNRIRELHVWGHGDQVA